MPSDNFSRQIGQVLCHHTSEQIDVDEKLFCPWQLHPKKFFGFPRAQYTRTFNLLTELTPMKNASSNVVWKLKEFSRGLGGCPLDEGRWKIDFLFFSRLESEIVQEMMLPSLRAGRWNILFPGARLYRGGKMHFRVATIERAKHGDVVRDGENEKVPRFLLATSTLSHPNCTCTKCLRDRVKREFQSRGNPLLSRSLMFIARFTNDIRQTKLRV